MTTYSYEAGAGRGLQNNQGQPIVLSILCAASASRRGELLPASLRQLYGLKDRLPLRDRSRVEILYLVDDYERTVGAKRDALLHLAQGKYVAFVDDDDRVDRLYLEELLRLTQTNADVLCFPVMVHQPFLDHRPGDPATPATPADREKVCYYNFRYPNQDNTYEFFRRWPNHLMAVKKELALRAGGFDAHANRGEDVDFAARLRPLLASQADSPHVLYHYDFDPRQTLTQIEDAPAIAALVLISWAKTPVLREMTQDAIDSAHASGPYPLPDFLPVVVIEQDRTAAEAGYRNAHTIYRPLEVYPFHQFNYNVAAEAGILTATQRFLVQHGREPELVIVSNNDVVFQRGWLAGLLSTHRLLQDRYAGPATPVHRRPYHVLSPVDDWDKRQAAIDQDEEGVVTGRHLAGWCFAIEPALWRKLRDPNPDPAFRAAGHEHLDSTYPYWCADNALSEQLAALDPKPQIVAVPAFRAAHLESRTGALHEIDPALTWAAAQRWNNVHHTRMLADDPRYRAFVAGLPIPGHVTSRRAAG